MLANKPPGDKGAGAGLSLAPPTSRPDGLAVQSAQSSVLSRALASSAYFLSGALCINASQFLGAPLSLINSDLYNAWIGFTKQSFALLTTTLTQVFSPTTVIVSGDASVRGELRQRPDGTLQLDFPERIVLIANHQIYTDWLYLWWAAYCSGRHGSLYIILKESLKKLPIFGWGMQFSQFIFLKRNWEQDREQMATALGRLNKLSRPMWLLLFPEGTNLAANTRRKSAAWAQKNGMRDMRHCLLPRSTGLRFCLQELKATTPYVYDCTIAYEGVPRGTFAQDIFTLRAGYIEGKPPKSISMYWRKFAIKDIPVHNEKAFDLWLLARWREKDLLIENYLIHGRFPCDKGISKTVDGKVKRGCGHLKVSVKSNQWYEFLQIFAPMGVLAMVLYAFYGALPQRLWASNGKQSAEGSLKSTGNSGATASDTESPQTSDLGSVFDKNQQAQTFNNAFKSINQWLQTPETKKLISRAEMVRAWVDDPTKAFFDSTVGSSQKQSFLMEMKDEESKRKKLTNPHQGNFWNDLNTEELSRNGSLVSLPTSSSTSLKTAPLKKGSGSVQPVKLKRKPVKLKPKTSKGQFWANLENEQNRRGGSTNS